jgi:HemK-related putative methylase
MGCCETVYEPSDDSYLLLSAAKFARGEILDMCAGTGIVGLNAASHARHVLLVDNDDDAIMIITNNITRNSIGNASVLKSDLFENLGGTRFDVIYANPPYLPENNGANENALVGGKVGYEMTCRIIRGLKAHLNEGGDAYIIVSSVYDVSKVYSEAASSGLRYDIMEKKNFFFEDLILLHLYG